MKAFEKAGFEIHEVEWGSDVAGTLGCSLDGKEQFVGPKLIGSSLGRPFSRRVVATDASPSGWGICAAELPPEKAAELGRWCERWRFRRLGPDEWAPRRRVEGLNLDPLAHPWTVPARTFGESGFVVPSKLQWEAREGFTEITDCPKLLWKVTRLGRFRFEEHITAKEAYRAV